MDKIIISGKLQEPEPYIDIVSSRISHFDERRTFLTRVHIWQSGFDRAKYVIGSIKGTNVQKAEERKDGSK